MRFATNDTVRAAALLLSVAALGACNPLLGNEERTYRTPREAGTPGEDDDAGAVIRDAAVSDTGADPEPDPGEDGCAPGYRESDGGCVSLCVDAECDSHAQCSLRDDLPVCRCLRPYAGDGKSCHLTCAGAPCERGTCSDVETGYECACPRGYEGTNCELDIDECAAKPCARGTCAQAAPGDFSCTCPVGWTGKRCETGTCTGVACAASAPCRVPTGKGGVCFPMNCVDKPGLCLAYNADGGGTASSEPLTERNDTFNFGADNDWNNKARYFSYLVPVASFQYVCVYPQLNLGGTPLVIPLGEARTRPAVFGQSNAFPDDAACSRFAP